jgi:glutamate:Na+ symporter, ESS family
VSAESFGLSAVVLSLLLLTGFLIRLKIRALQKFFIPSSVIVGFTGLILGPEVLGAVVGGEVPLLSTGIFPNEMLEVWRELPGLLITVIFATIFLGKKIEPLKKIW